MAENLRGTSGNDFLTVATADTTYLGGAGNDTYSIDQNRVEAGDTININDTEGANRIQLVGGLEIVSSQVATLDNGVSQLFLTLSNGTNILVNGASNFGFDVGGLFGGDGATAQTFNELVTETLGYADVPAAGEQASVETPVVIDGEPPEPPQPDTFTVADALAAGDDLPADYVIRDSADNLLDNLEVSVVSQAPLLELNDDPASVAQVLALRDVTNFNLSGEYALADTLANLSAADPAIVVGATAHTLTDESGDLGTLDAAQVGIVESATNTDDYTWEGEPTPQPGQDFTLTTAADSVPGLIGSDGTDDTSGDDTYVATDTTLSAADRITDSGGVNELLYGQSGQTGNVSLGAFQMSGVQTVAVTNDSGDFGSVTFDFSGTNDLALVESRNSREDVVFDEITALPDGEGITAVKVESSTNAHALDAIYQNDVLEGGNDTVDLMLSATSRTNSSIGVITMGRSDNNGDGRANDGIENLNIKLDGANTAVTQIDSNVNNITIEGDGSSLAVDRYLNNPLRNLDAAEFTGDLDLSIGAGLGEGTPLTATLGSGEDELLVGGGQLDVVLGSGDDRIIIDTRDTINTTTNKGFRADDSINGGEEPDPLAEETDPLDGGTDTLQLGFFDPDTTSPTFNPWTGGTGDGGTFELSTTEFNNKESLEVIDVRAFITNLTLSQAFVDTAEETLLMTSDRVDRSEPGYLNNPAELTAANIAEANMTTTLDTTALTQNTPLDYVGGDGSDRLVLNNDTLSDSVDLDGGSEWNGNSGPASAGDYDTLTIVGDSTRTVIDSSDLTNVENVEGFNLIKSGATATFDLTLTQAFLNANTDPNDDATNTSIDDKVFQVFSTASENGVALGAGDTVNVKLDALPTAGRGFDFTSLEATGANVTYTVGGANSTSAAVNVPDTTPTGRADVIASRANPTDDAIDNLLIAEGAGFDTTSGFLIQGQRTATAGNDTLRVDDSTFFASDAVINLAFTTLPGVINTVEITDVVTPGTSNGVNSALAGSETNFPFAALPGADANSIDVVNLKAGSTGVVRVQNGQDVVADDDSIVTLGSAIGQGDTFTGTDGSHNVTPGAGDDDIGGDRNDPNAPGLNDGDNHVVSASIGNDFVKSGDGNDILNMQLGNDIVDAGAGNDDIGVFLAGGGSEHRLTLGAGEDEVFIFNAGPVVNGDLNRVNISDFSIADTSTTENDKLIMSSNGFRVSNGIYNSDVTSTANSVGNASVVEIAGSVFTYTGDATNTNAMLTHLNNTTFTGPNEVAAPNDQITVVAYNGAGNAAIYLAADTAGDQQIDQVELVGVIDNVVGIDALTSSNFG